MRHASVFTILCAMNGWTDTPVHDPFRMNADPPAGGAPAGGGGSAPAGGAPAAGGAAPTVPDGYISKDAVEKIVSDRVAKMAGERDGLNTKIGELTKQLEDIQHKQALAGKSEHEQKVIEVQRELQNMKTTLGTRDAELAAAKQETVGLGTQLQDYIARTEISGALAPVVVGAALADAVQLMTAQTQPKVEKQSDGQYRVVFTVDGMQMTSAVEAAKKWVASKPHLARHPGGGGGTNGNTAGGGVPNMGDMPTSMLLEVGLRQPPPAR